MDFENIKGKRKIHKDIGLRLKQLRLNSKLTQLMLAKDFHTGQDTISKYECGLYITKKLAVLYSIRFNASYDWILTGEGEMYNEVSNGNANWSC